MPLKCAVVGGGVASDKHLAGLRNHPKTDLVALCDRDESRARTKAMEYDVEAYADAEAMLAREELDWLHVCPSAHPHLQLAEMALEDGLAVQIETPVTTSVGEAKSLERLAKESEGRVSIAHSGSFSPVIQEATALIADGRIGDLRSVDLLYAGESYPDDVHRGAWTTDLPGGEFEGGLPDPIHTVLHLGGHPATARSIRASTAASRTYEGTFDYDGVQFSYTTEDGVLCSGTVLASDVPHRTIRVHGDSGTIDVDLLSQSLTVLDRDGKRTTDEAAGSPVGRLADRLRSAVGDALTTVQDTGDESPTTQGAYYAQIERDARAIETGERLSIPVVEGRWTLQIIEALRATTAESTGGDRIRLGPEPM